MAIVYDTNIYNTTDCILRYKLTTLPSSTGNVEGNCAFVIGQEDSWAGTYPGIGTFTNIADTDFSLDSPISLGSVSFTSNKYLLSAILTGLPSSNVYSASFWGKKTNSVTNALGFVIRNSGGTTYGLKFTNGLVYWSQENATSNQFMALGGGAYSIVPFYDVWALYTVVQAGATVYLYINGVKVASAAASYTFVPYDVIVGNYKTFGSSFNGRICDFRFYKRSLSDNEVNQLYKDRAKSDINNNFYANSVIESDDNLISYVDSTIQIGLDNTGSTISATVGLNTYSFGNGIESSNGAGTNKLVVNVVPGYIELLANSIVGKGGLVWDISKVNGGKTLVAGRTYAIVFDATGVVSAAPDIYGFFPNLSSASGSQYPNSQISTSGDNTNKYFIFEATTGIINTNHYFIIGWSSLSGKTINLRIDTIQLYDITDRAFDIDVIRQLQGTVYAEIEIYSHTLDSGVSYGKNGAVIVNKLYEG